MSNIIEAVSTWDQQTARVQAAADMDPTNIAKALAGLPDARAQTSALPFLSADEIALVHEAIDRFEAALRARPEHGS